MKVTAYRFGRIDIDGRTYRSDVIVTPERVVDTGEWSHLQSRFRAREAPARRPRAADSREPSLGRSTALSVIESSSSARAGCLCARRTLMDKAAVFGPPVC